MLLKGTHQPAERTKANLVLAALFSGTFVLGTAELIVVGLLDLIAADLQVSHPAAGALVTANALGLAIGGPILTALTIKLNKRTVLIGTLGLFILTTLAPVLTSDYGLFVAARSIAGAAQGLFIAAGSPPVSPSFRRSAWAARSRWSSPASRSPPPSVCRWAR
jgi:DHA1 family inner membrane transport protein